MTQLERRRGVSLRCERALKRKLDLHLCKSSPSCQTKSNAETGRVRNATDRQQED